MDILQAFTAPSHPLRNSLIVVQDYVLYGLLFVSGTAGFTSYFLKDHSLHCMAVRNCAHNYAEQCGNTTDNISVPMSLTDAHYLADRCHYYVPWPVKYTQILLFSLAVVMYVLHNIWMKLPPYAQIVNQYVKLDIKDAKNLAASVKSPKVDNSKKNKPEAGGEEQPLKESKAEGEEQPKEECNSQRRPRPNCSVIQLERDINKLGGKMWRRLTIVFFVQEVLNFIISLVLFAIIMSKFLTADKDFSHFVCSVSLNMKRTEDEYRCTVHGYHSMKPIYILSAGLLCLMWVLKLLGSLLLLRRICCSEGDKKISNDADFLDWMRVKQDNGGNDETTMRTRSDGVQTLEEQQNPSNNTTMISVLDRLISVGHDIIKEQQSGNNNTISMISALDQLTGIVDGIGQEQKRYNMMNVKADTEIVPSQVNPQEAGE